MMIVCIQVPTHSETDGTSEWLTCALRLVSLSNILLQAHIFEILLLLKGILQIHYHLAFYLKAKEQIMYYK